MQLAEAAFLVTGATDGIGRATALALAQEGASVILHGRNPAKLAAVHAEILTHSGNRRLHMVLADFASLADVAALADRGACRDSPASMFSLIMQACLLIIDR